MFKQEIHLQMVVFPLSVFLGCNISGKKAAKPWKGQKIPVIQMAGAKGSGAWMGTMIRDMDHFLT